MRVLIVDDSEDTAIIMSKFFQHTGHETRTAASGKDAFRLVADFDPEVVLLDICLPEMDGYEVAKRLRQRPGADQLRIIALSGINPDPELDREAGIDGHLLKPVRMSEILQALTRPADMHTVR